MWTQLKRTLASERGSAEPIVITIIAGVVTVGGIALAPEVFDAARDASAEKTLSVISTSELLHSVTDPTYADLDELIARGYIEEVTETDAEGNLVLVVETGTDGGRPTWAAAARSASGAVFVVAEGSSRVYPAEEAVGFAAEVAALLPVLPVE